MEQVYKMYLALLKWSFSNLLQTLLHFVLDGNVVYQGQVHSPNGILQASNSNRKVTEIHGCLKSFVQNCAQTMFGVLNKPICVW